MMVRAQWLPQNGQVTFPSRVKERARTAGKPMNEVPPRASDPSRAPSAPADPAACAARSTCSLASRAAPMAPMRPG